MKMSNENKRVHVDTSYHKKQQHKNKIEAFKKMKVEEQRKKAEESMAIIRTTLSRLELQYNGEEKNLDTEYNTQLEESRKRVREAIQTDKEKLKKEKAEKEALVKAQKEKEQKDIAEKQKAEAEAKAQKEKEEKARLQAKSSAASISGLELYKTYIKKLDHYKQHYKPKLQDAKYRSTVFKERMPIKRFLKQLQFKTEVVDQRYVAIRDRLLAVKTQSEDAFNILLNCTAKDFLKQARSEISSISWGAYFYARFAMLLGAAIPEFMEYLLARLYKRCPYLIPEYHDESGLSLDQVKAKQRFEYVDNDKKEFQTVDMHYLYQYAYVMFYAALVQMTPQLASDPQNPHGIENGWLWLARICNVPPRAITPGLVYSFLQIAGRPLLNAYPRQSIKVFQLIRADMLPVAPKSRENASPLNELGRFLDDFFRTGQMDKMPEKAETKV
ncbi:GLE1-like protein-domain-containing protein [Phascolomyces articulosus]|uniref:mRNA export factor GLE1 n=1 Tax=Phascolomyces articulosus TaxID=60185 RepID=A0AAD5KFD2_9FUNG|nr:GLE1-like protein-domain-containing protein [Phascolomyces articulosus]